MATATTEAPADPVGDYVLLKSTEAAAPPAEPEAEPLPELKHPWRSGYCNADPCRDGRETNKAGEPIRRCRYVAENGAKAPRRFLYCSCSCHQDPERAGQAVARD